MFKRLFSRKPDNPVPSQLYESVVEQARTPVLFTDFGFADSVTGRFDALCLHLFLFSRRLVRASEPLAASLNQEVFDIFTKETDRALRELGVGDTSVPKRKKKMVRTFYAMVEEFSALLDEADHEGLKKAVSIRFGNGKSGEPVKSGQLASYMSKCATDLDRQLADAILAGTLIWPSPGKS